MAKKYGVGRRRRIVAAGIMTAGALAASTVAAGRASAATVPLQLQPDVCGTGSSVTWNSALDPVLTVGIANAGTCNQIPSAPSNPAYAGVDIFPWFASESEYSAVPTTEPTFTATGNSAAQAGGTAFAASTFPASAS